MGETPYHIEGAQRTLSIIGTISRLGEASLSEVAEDTKLTRGTAFRYLSALEQMGYLERMGKDIPGARDRTWTVGPALMGIVDNVAEFGKPAEPLLELREALLAKVAEATAQE